MERRYFDVRDIFQVIRYGFSGRKIAVHFIGLVLAYLIYEVLVYLSLAISGGTAVQDFWQRYALLPVPPFSDTGLLPITEAAMWVGLVTFACIFFFASTVASKITIEQLRGDAFFSVGAALTFLKRQWVSVLGAFLCLLLIQGFIACIPLSLAGIGRLPVVGEPVLMLASVLLPLGLFFGLLIAWIAIVFSVSLFFVPAVAATTGADAFEIVYQQFAIAWNTPSLFVCYEVLLLLLKLIFVPIWGLFCLIGFSLVLFPMGMFHTETLQHGMHQANLWLGGAVEKIATLPYIGDFGVFSTSTSPAVSTLTATVGAIFLTMTLLMGAGLVIAYLFSIASAGNTVIYTLLRKRIDGQNLLEPPETALIKN